MPVAELTRAYPGRNPQHFRQAAQISGNPASLDHIPPLERAPDTRLELEPKTADDMKGEAGVITVTAFRYTEPYGESELVTELAHNPPCKTTRIFSIR